MKPCKWRNDLKNKNLKERITWNKLSDSNIQTKWIREIFLSFHKSAARLSCAALALQCTGSVCELGDCDRSRRWSNANRYSVQRVLHSASLRSSCRSGSAVLERPVNSAFRRRQRERPSVLGHAVPLRRASDKHKINHELCLQHTHTHCICTDSPAVHTL